MTRHMFSDVVDPSITVGSSRRYTVPLSIAAHTIVIGALIVVPLAALGALPSPPSLMSFIVVAQAPLPPPPAPAAAPSAPVRPGGTIRQPVRIKDAAPVYPSIAQAARVEGVVIIEATIDVNGRVQDAKILRSIPLLDAAAIDAVRQWQYTPTLLNGMPVPVIITVTVNFKLN